MDLLPANYFGALLIAIQDRLKKQVPELRWIDADFGQLEVFQYRPAVAFPCALIDFQDTEYSNLSEHSQMGEVQISVRLGFAPFSASQANAPDNVRQQALQYYAVEQCVYRALQGWQPEADNEAFAQPLSRLRATTEQRLSASGAQDASGLRVRVLNFRTAFEDHTAQPQFTTVTAALEVQQEFNL